MIPLLLIAIAGAAVFYLGHRALITRWLWSRYPAWFNSLMGCAACLGTWVGLGIGAWLFHVKRPLLEVSGWPVILTAGAAGMVLTPIAAAALLYTLAMIGGSDGDQSES